MRDLRDVLDDLAGRPTALPDLESIRRIARPHLIRRRLLAAGACVLVALAGWSGARSIVLLGQDQPVVRPAPASSCSAPGTPPGGSTIVGDTERINLGAPAWSTQFGFAGAWVQVDPPVDQLVKVDQVTGSVALAINGGRGVAIAPDAVWVAVGGQKLAKIDPFTCETLLSVPAASNYVAVGHGSVWASSDNAVLRFDEDTGAPLAEITAGAVALRDLLVTDDGVWVAARNAGTVFRIDPDRNTVVAEIAVDNGPQGLAADEHGVWVTSQYGSGSVTLIDPDSNEVVTTIPGVGSGIGITTGGGYVWVGTKNRGISRIDPTTYDTTVVTEQNEWNYGVAYGDDDLWVSSTFGWIYRVPLR